ncbi:hypothetical protein CHC07_05885 [Variovorax sp. B4]|nr:hypothetical protein CHC06_05979 [Variovorax sp. B2]PNG51229.1 hypothetical protein CHC07_05885 [Variovorax sp. B4]
MSGYARTSSKRLREADELAAVKEGERVAWGVSQQLRERTAALGLTRVSVIRSCLGASGGTVHDARGEYRFLRAFKGEALPDPSELMLLAAAPQCSVRDLLDGVDPARIEVLRQVRALKRVARIAEEFPDRRAA